jgi:hypothetical protein
VEPLSQLGRNRFVATRSFRLDQRSNILVIQPDDVPTLVITGVPTALVEQFAIVDPATHKKAEPPSPL